MANPFQTTGAHAASNIGSASNLDNFYGYGSKFVSDKQFVLDMKENISLFGADASPFYSWSSMVRKNPTHSTEFSWMEDELFVHRDISCVLKRTVGDTGKYVYTIKMMNAADWSAFEAAPLADALTQSALGASSVAGLANGPTIYARIYNPAVSGVGVLNFIPTAAGLANGPQVRTFTNAKGNSMTIQNELVVADDSATAGTIAIGGITAWTNYERDLFRYCSDGSGATTAEKDITKTNLDALWTADTVTGCYIHVFTPNEHFKGFAQGSGLPNESRKRIRSFKNYVQIFKTPYSIANTLKSIQLYGGPELAKLRYRKAVQHKIDIERAILFQGGGTENGSSAPNWGYIGGTSLENPITRFKGLGVGTTTLGTAGWIVSKNGGIDSAFRLPANATGTMSDLNGLTRRLFEDNIEGGSSTSKVVFASKKWMQVLSEMAFRAGNGGAMGGAAGFAWGNMVQKEGRLGTKVRTLETPFGDLNFVDMPHFRGMYEDYALVVDFNHIEIRPLRDTVLNANCGDGTIDGQIDYYLTEVGFECRHEAAHAILKLS